MPSDHVGHDIIALEHAVSTLMNFIYPNSLFAVLI